MYATYDSITDEVYIYLTRRAGVKSARQVYVDGEGIVLDFDSKGRVIGLELLRKELLHPDVSMRVLEKVSALPDEG
jgi:uncharacterized protein YuzE